MPEQFLGNFRRHEISVIQIALNDNSLRIIDKNTVLDHDEIEIKKAIESLKNIRTSHDVLSITKKEVYLLIDGLAGLIGYDPVENDIDSLGREADSIISKLLELLRHYSP